MTSPPDGEDADEVFARLLLAYDADLAAGRIPDPRTEGFLLPALRARLERARACLDLLAQDRAALQQSAAGGAGSDSLPQPEGGERRLGRFRILRELGRGGFGIVFLAADPLRRQPVALKVPRPEILFLPEFRARFLREARAAARLDHPNIVPVLESGQSGPLCYLVTAYCPGGTLAAHLRERREPLPVATAARLVAALADAVQHAHDRGLLHRDVKPGNVLLEPAAAGDAGLDFLTRLTDFGLAKFVEEESSSSRGRGAGPGDAGAPAQTAAGAVLGTPEYMAPEQAQGWTDYVGRATDVHALGVLLYEALTGRVPFAGRDREEVLRRVAAEPPPRPRALRRAVPRDLEAVCLRCLEKQPTERYATAAGLAGDLRRFLAGAPVDARRVGGVERLWRLVRRR